MTTNSPLDKLTQRKGCVMGQLLICLFFVVWAAGVVFSYDGSHPQLAMIVFAWPVCTLGALCGVVTALVIMAALRRPDPSLNRHLGG